LGQLTYVAPVAPCAFRGVEGALFMLPSVRSVGAWNSPFDLLT
jgi:hypothetical protein